MTINLEKLTRFLQSLVQLNTEAGDEKPVIERVAAEMRRLRFDTVYIDSTGNAVGIIQGAQSGPTLLFDGHCDTVGIAPGAPWQHNPFAAEIKNGRMYGRGTSDMKGAVAAMVHAAAAVDRTRLAGRVVISASVMEEVMEGLALRTVMDKEQPDFVVIGESTDLNLAHGGRGRAEIHLESIGIPTHSSAPHLGKNAVHLMLPAIQAIENMPLPNDPLLGSAVLALTDIISEPYPGHSVTPSRCRVTYDRRLVAGESPQSVVEAIQALPGMENINVSMGQGKYTAYTGATLSASKFFPAWKLPPDHALVQAALNGLRAANLEPELRAYQFCTNAAYSAGAANAPTVGFGPATESRAHMVDEYIELKELESAARGYLGIIKSVLKP